MNNTESRNFQKKKKNHIQPTSCLRGRVFKRLFVFRLCGDHGSLTRDGTQYPCSGNGVLSTGPLEKSLRGRDLYRERAIEVKLACFSVDIANQRACYIQEENTLKTWSNKQKKQVIRVLALQIHKTLDHFLFK